MYCLGHMYSSKTVGTDFKGYCNAENQDNDKFWLNFSENRMTWMLVLEYLNT